MHFNEADSIVRSFRYKTTSLTELIFTEYSSNFTLSFNMNTVDADTNLPMKTKTIYHIRFRDFKEMSENQFKELVRNIIKSAEIHEADEWIRFGKERPFNPHESNNEF